MGKAKRHLSGFLLKDCRSFRKDIKTVTGLITVISAVYKMHIYYIRSKHHIEETTFQSLSSFGSVRTW